MPAAVECPDICLCYFPQEKCEKQEGSEHGVHGHKGAKNMEHRLWEEVRGAHGDLLCNIYITVNKCSDVNILPQKQCIWILP